MPPPATESVPESEGVKVSVSPEPTTVVPIVRPLNDPVEVAIVTAGPSWSWLAGPIEVTPPELVPQAAPTPETLPLASTWRHCVDPVMLVSQVPPETVSAVVDALLLNCCSALQLFAVVVPKASEMVFAIFRSG